MGMWECAWVSEWEEQREWVRGIACEWAFDSALSFTGKIAKKVDRSLTDESVTGSYRMYVGLSSK